MKSDTLIFEYIKEEKERQLRGLELIASENFVSEQVMRAMGSVLTNKYAEGLPGKRYYGGCEVVDKVEQLAIDRIKALYHAEWVNVQPHSGAQANAAVMLGVLKPGDKFSSITSGDLSGNLMVLIDGAVYYRFGGTIYPMQGGGASGCFDPNVDARIQKARMKFAEQSKAEQEKKD